MGSDGSPNADPSSPSNTLDRALRCDSLGYGDSALVLYSSGFSVDSQFCAARKTATATDSIIRRALDTYLPRIIELDRRQAQLMSEHFAEVAGQVHIPYRTYADLLVFQARCSSRLGEKERALLLADSAYDVLLQKSDTMNTTAPQALNLAASNAIKLGRIPEGIQKVEKLIVIAQHIGDHAHVAEILGSRCGQLVLTDSVIAKNWLQESEAAAQRSGDTLELCRAKFSRGSFHNILGQSQRSLQSQVEGIELCEKWHGIKGNIPGILFSYVIGSSDLMSAHSYLERWNVLRQRYHSAVGEVAYFRASASVALGLGDTRKALVYAERALELAKFARLRENDPGQYLLIAVPLSMCYYNLERYNDVEQLVEPLLNAPDLSGPKMKEVMDGLRNNLGNSKRMLGKCDEAIALHTSITWAASTWWGKFNLYDDYCAKGDTITADSSLRNFIDAQLQAGKPERDLLNRAYRLLALRDYKAGLFTQAVEHCDSALNATFPVGIHHHPEIAISTKGFSPVMLNPLATRAESQFEQWRKTRSEETRKDAIATDNTLRVLMDTLIAVTMDPAQRANLLEVVAASADRSIGLLLPDSTTNTSEDVVDQIFRLITYGRDRSFARAENMKDPELADRVPPQLLEAETVLSAALNQHMARGADDPSETAKELSNIIDSIEAVRGRILDAWPGYSSFAARMRPPGLAATQAKLPPGTLLLVQHVTAHDSTLLTIAVVRDGWSIRRSKFDPNLPTTYRNELVTTGSKGAVMRSAAELKQLTLEPFLTDATDQCVIAPAPAFSGLPFDTFDTINDTQRDQNTAARRFPTIRYINSALDLTIGRQDPSRVGAFAGYAPDYSLVESDDPKDISMKEDRENVLVPLTSNAAEVREASHLLGGKSFVGEDATESKFRTTAPNAEVIHLAMHAVVDKGSPQFNEMIFQPSSLRPDGDTTPLAAFDDGLLHSFELYGVKLKCDLAVLSACETGVGTYQPGEGVMSLARAFRNSGAKNVVTTLWKVDDRATKEIMVKFYEKLAEGMGKADALAEAKRWYRKENTNAPPSEWAAFILIGDNEPVHLKKRSPMRPWMIGGGAVVALAAALARRRRRRAQQAG